MAGISWVWRVISRDLECDMCHAVFINMCGYNETIKASRCNWGFFKIGLPSSSWVFPPVPPFSGTTNTGRGGDGILVPLYPLFGTFGTLGLRVSACRSLTITVFSRYALTVIVDRGLKCMLGLGELRPDENLRN